MKPRVKIVTLDLDPQTTRHCKKMTDVLWQAFKAALVERSMERSDVEYAEVNGILTVPRLVPDASKDQYVLEQMCGDCEVLQP